jgi:hypothetical protein
MSSSTRQAAASAVVPRFADCVELSSLSRKSFFGDKYTPAGFRGNKDLSFWDENAPSRILRKQVFFGDESRILRKQVFFGDENTTSRILR